MQGVCCRWRFSTLEVLTVFTAGLSNATLIFFNRIPLIPGITELRPNNVIPLIFGVLFGPTNAWDAAFANRIGDFLDPLGPESFSGYWGNSLVDSLPSQRLPVSRLRPPALVKLFSGLGFFALTIGDLRECLAGFGAVEPGSFSGPKG
jgi:hypothetical protein